MVSYRCQAVSGFESPCLPASDFITISYAYIVLRSGWHVDCCIRCMRHLYPTVHGISIRSQSTMSPFGFLPASICMDFAVTGVGY